MLSHTEENYLKAIYKIVERSGQNANTNAIAAELATTAASVTDMLKKLAEKSLIHYERYKGVSLTREGAALAKSLVRRHRLWEVFLVEKLGYSWDAIHEIAEELEHINAPDLIERLNNFLGKPKFDPHGDPIPDADGNYTVRKQRIFQELDIGQVAVVVGVREHTAAFLQHLERLKLVLGATVELMEVYEFDQSVRIKRTFGQSTEELTISNRVCQNIFVQEI